MTRSAKVANKAERAYALRFLIPLITLHQAHDVKGIIDAEINRMREQFYEVARQRTGRRI